MTENNKIPEIDKTKPNFTIGFKKDNPEELVIINNHRESSKYDIAMMLTQAQSQNTMMHLQEMKQISEAVKQRELQERKEMNKSSRKSKQTKKQKQNNATTSNN